MSAELARQRYLRRHMEPGLPASPRSKAWRNVLVVPAYREAARWLERLQALPQNAGNTLVILVLNRPDSDPDDNANRALRQAIGGLAGSGPGLKVLNPGAELYLHDIDLVSGPIPKAQGVGLARKIGCDIAFKWQCEGAIDSHWICSTDADARLPPDYFLRLGRAPAHAAAAVYPFWHTPATDPACNLATALYELRLHHYVLGLEYADSPYACHTLGSCLAVTFDAYAQVRGMPRRAGAEDFYLLNKLAKVAPVTRLAGECIALASRESARVPFGTGPAVAKISAALHPHELPLFDNPACFAALRSLLCALPALHRTAVPDLTGALLETGLEPALAHTASAVLDRMGITQALAHCRRQGKTPAQFERHFHQWFDAFRSLKFSHGLRDAGWPLRSFAQLAAAPPAFWPAATADPDQLRSTIARRWGWTPTAVSDWQ